MTNWPHLRRPSTKKKSLFGRPKLASPNQVLFLALTHSKLSPWPKQAQKLRFSILNLPFYILSGTDRGDLNKRVPLRSLSIG